MHDATSVRMRPVSIYSRHASCVASSMDAAKTLLLSVQMCIKAVMASTQGAFEEGVARESEYSMVLFTSNQAQALQYAFFAQRAATKVTASFQNTRDQTFRRLRGFGKTSSKLFWR